MYVVIENKIFSLNTHRCRCGIFFSCGTFLKEFVSDVFLQLLRYLQLPNALQHVVPRGAPLHSAVLQVGGHLDDTQGSTTNKASQNGHHTFVLSLSN